MSKEEGEKEEKCFEESYAIHLRLMLDNFKQNKFSYSENDRYKQILIELLSCTDYFLKNFLANKHNESRKNIYKNFCEARSVIEQFPVIKKFEDTQIKSMEIGEFIEGLIYYGMSRKPALEAVSKWLRMGESTVRTYNEEYRNCFDLKKDGNLNFIVPAQIFYGPYRDGIKRLIETSGEFPNDHVTASSAFKNLEKLYKDNARSIVNQDHSEQVRSYLLRTHRISA